MFEKNGLGKVSKYAIEKPKTQISEENARTEVIKILQHYNFDIEAGDPDEQKKNEKALDRITRLFMDGTFSLDETAGNFGVKQALKSTPGTLKEITYREFTGEVRVAADGHDPKTEMMSFSYAMLGALSGLGIDGIKKLQGSDLVAMEALGSLFFTLMS